jgi:hypothetical protein
MHVRLFSFVYFIDAVLEMREALYVDFVVNTVGQLPFIGRFSINSLETDVFYIFAKDL